MEEMAIHLLFCRSVSYYTQHDDGVYLVYTPFHSENASTSTVVWESIANSMIMIGVIVVMTVFLVVLYKYRSDPFSTFQEGSSKK